mgnify:FL=1
MRLLDVNKPVLKRDGEPLWEVLIDARNRICLEPVNGEPRQPKFQHQSFAKDDIPVMVERQIGWIINFALDRTDASIKPEEGRLRFKLSMRIEDAMRHKVPLLIDKKDEDRIEAAADLLVEVNHMFMQRIYEAVESAGPPLTETAKPTAVKEAAE